MLGIEPGCLHIHTRQALYHRTIFSALWHDFFFLVRYIKHQKKNLQFHTGMFLFGYAAPFGGRGPITSISFPKGERICPMELLQPASVRTWGAHIFLICLSFLPFLVCHDHPNTQGFKHGVIAIGSSWWSRRKKNASLERQRGLGRDLSEGASGSQWILTGTCGGWRWREQGGASCVMPGSPIYKGF